MFEFSGVANLFKLGNSLAKANSRVVQGENAVVILGEIEKMLEGSKMMLDGMVESLATEQLRIYTIQYRRIVTDSQAMRSKLRRDAKRNDSDDEISNLEQFSADVALLFDTTERFHTDLVTASSQMNQLEEDRLFARLESRPSLASTRSHSSTSTLDSQSTAASETSTLAAGEYICIPNLRGDRSSQPQDRPRYCREILILEDIEDRSQVIMIGKNPILLTEAGNVENDMSTLERARIGKEVLRTGNVNNLAGKYILHVGHDPTWVDTLIHKVSLMGLGIRAPVQPYKFGNMTSASASSSHLDSID